MDFGSYQEDIGDGHLVTGKAIRKLSAHMEYLYHKLWHQSDINIPYLGQNHFWDGESSSITHPILKYFSEWASSGQGIPYKILVLVQSINHSPDDFPALYSLDILHKPFGHNSQSLLS